MKIILSVFSILFVLLAFPKNINASGDVLINEALANPNEGEGEWVEFYFPNDYFDLTGYYLEDTIGKKKNIDSPQVCGNYVVLDVPEGRWLNNNEEETIRLFDSEGNQIDSRTGKDPGKGKTLGRTPDGSDSWNETENPTKCTGNSSAKVEVSEPTNNSSSNSPSPSPTTTQSAPKSSPKATPKISPSASANTKKEVLGEKTSSPEATPSINSFITPAPSTAPSPIETKIANFAFGGGAILIVLSLAGYLWYKWEIKKSPKEADKNE